jgi:RNA polymerase sigma-70 factor (ECF subfamily)
MTLALARVEIPALVMTEDLSDEALLLRIQAEDEDAYRILVERHIDRAFGIALRLLRNTADAEDVAQDALVRTWTNRHAWQSGRAKFTTWLYRVIVNRCIDLSRSPTGEGLDDVPEPADEADDSVTVIHKQEVQSALEAALARLPKQQRAAVVLSYYEDCSNAQVAEIMGTTVDAVESLLKRGRQRLRDILHRSSREFERMSFA